MGQAFLFRNQSVLFVISWYSQYRALLLLFNNYCVPLKYRRFTPAMLFFFFASWYCHPPLHCALTISLFYFFPPRSLYETAYNVSVIMVYKTYLAIPPVAFSEKFQMLPWLPIPLQW